MRRNTNTNKNNKTTTPFFTSEFWDSYRFWNSRKLKKGNPRFPWKRERKWTLPWEALSTLTFSFALQQSIKQWESQQKKQQKKKKKIPIICKFLRERKIIFKIVVTSFVNEPKEESMEQKKWRTEKSKAKKSSTWFISSFFPCPLTCGKSSSNHLSGWQTGTNFKSRSLSRDRTAMKKAGNGKGRDFSSNPDAGPGTRLVRNFQIRSGIRNTEFRQNFSGLEHGIRNCPKLSKSWGNLIKYQFFLHFGNFWV